MLFSLAFSASIGIELMDETLVGAASPEALTLVAPR